MSGRPRWVGTYRLQLTPTFGFEAAAATVPYLTRLGISHLYLSPIFEARPGSLHGYDQTDPQRIRAELGGEAAFGRLVGRAREAGLGIAIDIVPNHMAADHRNRWWFGLLKEGRQSEFDRFFDVEWNAGGGRVVLPVLGATLDEAIERGELRVERRDGFGSVVAYFDRVFPLRDDVDVRASNGRELAELLSRQHYELAYWRDGLARLNYRRFFDVSDLVATRVEDPAVFDAMHAATLELVSRGWIDAVRVDHVDGLLDPAEYLIRLRRALDVASGRTGDIAVFIEKILGPDEELPHGWPVDGMTGYAFLAALGAVWTESQGVEALHRHAAETGTREMGFHDLAAACKREVGTLILGPEVRRVARIANEALRSGGIALDGEAVSSAVLDLSAHLDVYRTYADDAGISAEDERRILAAAARARAKSARPSAIEALAAMLALRGAFGEGAGRAAALRAVRAWQQLTGPLAAKGVEDTALYRDTSCLALGDVGSEPLPNEGVSAITRLAAMRHLRPLSLNATDTHDTKRSEDVRVRLASITHEPTGWLRTLDRIVETLAEALRDEGSVSPTRAHRTLIVQSALALWPEGAPDETLERRLREYAIKAAREARRRTNWLDPDPAYEASCQRAVELLLRAKPLAESRDALATLARRTRPLAGRLTLGAVALKTLFPGTPDWYQGREIRALALVDPDNREPIDFQARSELLRVIEREWSADPHAAAAGFLRDADSDRAKLFVTWRALAIRRSLLGSGAELRLESFSSERSRWRWSVRCGDRRCAVDAGIDVEPSEWATDEDGVDQLTGLSARESDLCVRIVMPSVSLVRSVA